MIINTGVKMEDIINILLNRISSMEIDEKIEMINKIKISLHEISPFKSEPVDCVVWVKNTNVVANDYNPNSVAPPEMKLLEQSINEDGYTQPIVAWKINNNYEVVDGFHRNRVGKESKIINERIHGYLPLSIINEERTDRGNRIAATIRHNRARGKHRVESMSDIVIELKNRNWTNDRIAKNLGMEEDEILRLCQITGLADMFSDQEFSKSWDIEDSEPDFDGLEENFENIKEFRNVNRGGEKRIFHTHDKWECFKAGFYNTTFQDKKKEECEKMYADFLSNIEKFSEALSRVINEWKYSCEHYLTNESMNRIAWLGQAAMCYATGVPSIFKGGWNLLSSEEKNNANEAALIYLNIWLKNNGYEEITMEKALSENQVDLY